MRSPHTTYHHHSGVAALFIIVVVGASALLMALGATFLGIDELNLGFVDARGEDVMALADGCLEEALERIRYNPAISLAALAANTPPYADGSCILEAIPFGSFIVLTVTASDGEYHKKNIAVINPALSGGQLISLTETSN
ncbi:MAG: hypothetical protein AAB367_03250 [Patescibacteria group bacterium]